MPRVRLIAKARESKKARRCTKCGNEIEVGQSFYVWTFRYGGDRFNHQSCGYPRPSQLTQSMMGEVYAAQEAIDDLGSDASYEDKASAMEELVSVVQDVASRYEEAASQFGNSGENQERYEALEGWVGELEEAQSQLSEAAEAVQTAEDALEKAKECPV